MNGLNASFLTDLSSGPPAFSNPEIPYSDQAEVLCATKLSHAQKQEILSSWASDTRAVPNAPALRAHDNGLTLRIHDILDGLKRLDATELWANDSRPVDFPLRVRKKPSAQRPANFRWRRKDDDDDDPPPCPAMITPLPLLPTSGAEAVLQAA